MPQTDERRFGDRTDGRRLRTMAPIKRITPYIVRNRQDASDYFTDRVEVSALERWLLNARAEQWPDMSAEHVLLAAYVRAVSMRPGLNRFVAGQRVYAHRRVDVVLTVRRSSTADGTETYVKLRLDPTDTVFDVYRKLKARMDKIRAGEDSNDMENLAKSLSNVPGFLIRFGMWLLRRLDNRGWLAEGIITASPYHGSVHISNTAASGQKPVLQHLNVAGTIPLSVTLGGRYTATETENGGAVTRKYMDIAYVFDDRIADGAYFTECFRLIDGFLADPRELEIPPERVEEDIL